MSLSGRRRAITATGSSSRSDGAPRWPWAAIRAVEPLVVGLDVEAVLGDLGGFCAASCTKATCGGWARRRASCTWRSGAVVNAVWDLYARRAGKPLWQLLAELTPRQVVDLIDFRYLTDALTSDEALQILTAAEPGKAARQQQLIDEGYPRVHHLGRLAGIQRRESDPTGARGARRRVHPPQAQGGRQHRRRRAPLRDGARPSWAPTS